MRILVLGGNRFFGRRLVELLAEAGHQVTVVNRGNLPNVQHPNVRWLKGDRENEQFLRDLANDEFWDVIYDQSCYSSAQALKMRVFQGRVGRFILTSSIAVYRSQGLLSESAFEPAKYRWAHGSAEDYFEAKRRIEALTRRHFSKSVLVRLPAVFGKDDNTERLRSHLHAVRWKVPMFCSGLNSEFPLISRDEAANALFTLLASPLEGPVNVSSENPVVFRDFLRMIETQVGRQAQLVSRPEEGRTSSLSISFPQRYDLSKWRSQHAVPADYSRWLPNVIADEDLRLQQELKKYPLRVAMPASDAKKSPVFNTDFSLKSEPFRHLIIDDFLPQDLYERLCDQMAEGLSDNLTSRQPADRFLKSQSQDPLTKKMYQALISRWSPDIASPAAIFYSREFFDFVQSQFQVPLAPEMLGSFHHHFKGNDSGWVHSDYNLVSFRMGKREDGLNPWTPFSTEEQRQGICEVRSMCRSVAILYYLHNPKWDEKFGGETGLWREERGNPEQKYAPLNNRLIAFEISPRSFHSFMTNAGGPRNCIAYWFHSDPRWMELRYGVPPMST